MRRPWTGFGTAAGSIGLTAVPLDTPRPLLADDRLYLFDRPLQVVIHDHVVIPLGDRHLLEGRLLTLAHDFFRLAVAAGAASRQLFERWGCNEDEDTIGTLPAHLLGALHVDLEDDV